MHRATHEEITADFASREVVCAQRFIDAQLVEARAALEVEIV